MTTLNSSDQPHAGTYSVVVELLTVTCFSNDIAGARTILKSEPDMIGVTFTSSTPRLVQMIESNEFISEIGNHANANVKIFNGFLKALSYSKRKITIWLNVI